MCAQEKDAYTIFAESTDSLYAVVDRIVLQGSINTVEIVNLSLRLGQLHPRCVCNVNIYRQTQSTDTAQASSGVKGIARFLQFLIYLSQ